MALRARSGRAVRAHPPPPRPRIPAGPLRRRTPVRPRACGAAAPLRRESSRDWSPARGARDRRNRRRRNRGGSSCTPTRPRLAGALPGLDRPGNHPEQRMWFRRAFTPATVERRATCTKLAQEMQPFVVELTGGGLERLAGTHWAQLARVERIAAGARLLEHAGEVRVDCGARDGMGAEA